MKSLTAEISTDRSLSIEKVLVAVNLSEHSETTAIYAAEIAKSFHAILTIAYVYQPVPLCEYVSENTCTVLEEQRSDLQRMLNELTRKIQKTNVRCQSAFLIGEPAEQISRLARDMEADLLVTASHHPTFRGRLFNLDQALRLQRRAPCPVLIYHEKDFVETNTHCRNFGIVRGAKQPGLV
jgi:nucleotide-binding universal stress UspA family protein